MTHNYQEELQTWRQKMDESLRADDSWLALAGLFWLSEGINPVGTDPSSAVVLPRGGAPEHMGDFELSGEEATLQVVSGTPVTVDGEVVHKAKLSPDVSGSPTKIRLGKLTMMLLKRGDRYAIRLWDNERPERLEFAGRKWYPIKESYRLSAQFINYEPTKVIPFPNELGEIEELEVVGYISFTLQGRECRLDALGVSSGGLLIIFKGQTSGVQTYPPGRYLVTEPPEDGEVIVDFNRAYNPPCAYTPYATCTLPPPQNHLGVQIEAGERYP